MIKNKKWQPEIPRPKLEDDVFAAFIKKWIEKEYPDFCEDIPAEETGLYATLLGNWNDSDDLMAEELIKWHGWNYSEAKEFEEKSLSWAIGRHEDNLEIDWIKETGYTLPFAVGSRVKWRGKSGVIQSDPENRYLKQGKVCVLTDEQAEENQRNQEQGISSRSGGYVVNWEDLELVESKNEQ